MAEDRGHRHNHTSGRTSSVVLSGQQLRRNYSHVGVKGQTTNKGHLVQANISNCSRHHQGIPSLSRAIKAQPQQRGPSPVRQPVGSSKCPNAQWKQSNLWYQKTSKSRSNIHTREECRLQSRDVTTNGGFQTPSKERGNVTKSESLTNQINPYINITIHPTTAAVTMGNGPDCYNKSDHSFMNVSGPPCSESVEDEFASLPEALKHQNFSCENKCWQSLYKAASVHFGPKPGSNPHLGTECSQDLHFLKNPTKRPSYGDIPSSCSSSCSEVTSQLPHNSHLFFFKAQNPSRFLSTSIQKAPHEFVGCKLVGEPTFPTNVPAHYPGKNNDLSPDNETPGKKHFPPEYGQESSVNLPGEAAFIGQYGRTASSCVATRDDQLLRPPEGGHGFMEDFWSPDEGCFGSVKICDYEVKGSHSQVFKETGPQNQPSGYVRPVDRHLLHCCFQAWHQEVTRKYESAHRLHERHLLQKGLRALVWAVVLQEGREGNTSREGRWAEDMSRLEDLGDQFWADMKKNILKRHFMTWRRHSENCRTAETLQRAGLERRTFSFWMSRTRQAIDVARAAEGRGLRKKGQWLFAIWKRRLFQRREVDMRVRRRKLAIIHVILINWDAYCQRKRRLCSELSLWNLNHAEQLKQQSVKIWRGHVWRRQQARLFWRNLVLGRSLQLWREKSVACSFGEKVLAWRKIWRHQTLRRVFVEWRRRAIVLSDCMIVQQRRARRLYTEAVQRWRRYVLEMRAERSLRRRTCLWALTKWRLTFHLQQELQRYRQVKLLHRRDIYWQVWVLQLQLTLECKRHHYRSLTRRTFSSWISAVRLHRTYRELTVHSHLRILHCYFQQWRMELRRKRRGHKPPTVPAMHSLQLWRAATRGHQALKLGTQHAVKKACHYWTRASSVSLCSRCHHVPIGRRKLRKVRLSVMRGSSGLANHCRDGGLVQSAFHHWLLLYRRHGRMDEAGQGDSGSPEPLSSPEDARCRNQENEADLSQMLQQFWHEMERRRRWLVWLHWSGLHRGLQAAQELDRKRLLENSWMKWRRSHLQSRTLSLLLAREERRLCLNVLTRWRQRTACRKLLGGVSGN
ncbi:uncharacterized protein C1orf167 homolog isoform X2 [Hyperolius riggenbachi]|uniref:uncharacterized protein C1orf167 homolog isoform X2 n=1 Tax=Hyperolius riggenbachi TaxID=752182 RepID=UPI0035A26315